MPKQVHIYYIIVMATVYILAGHFEMGVGISNYTFYPNGIIKHSGESA